MPDIQSQSILTQSGTSVVMFTAPNAGPKTLEGTHTYIVGRRPAAVIDPGPDYTEYVDSLVAWIRAEDVKVRAILITHQHPDHALGARRLADGLRVPIWASPNYESTSFEPVEPDFTYTSGQQFPVDEDVLRVIETPGHSPDHVAFWLEEGGILFSGDTILGRGTSLVAPPEGNMSAYLRSLQMLRSLEPFLIAPGHGPVITKAMAKIDEYMKHRQERERQVLELLAAEPLEIPDIVRRLYADVDPRLHDLAAGSVEAQLEKLVREGRVEERLGVFRVL